MPWWAWVVAVGAVAVVLTRRWNPISRASAADTLGRRWWLLVHFWPVWRVVIALAVASVAILIAVRPGPHQATVPAPVAGPSPTAVAHSPAGSPSPAATASPAAAGGEGHFPGPVFVVVLIGVGGAAALVVWLARRRSEDPGYWLGYGEDMDDEYDADGWPPGSDPEPNNDDDDTEDDNDGDDPGDWDTPSGQGPLVGERPAVVQHLGRGRWHRDPRIPRR